MPLEATLRRQELGPPQTLCFRLRDIHHEEQEDSENGHPFMLFMV